MRYVFGSRLGKLGHEKIELGPPFTLFVNLENDRDWLTQGHRRERSQEFRVLRLVPLGRETIRRANEELIALDLQGLRRLQPGLEGLLRQLLARPLEQSRPGFLCCESHDGFAGVENSRSAKLCAPYTIRNAVAPS